MGLVKWKRSLVWLLASLATSAILWVLLLSTISERVVDKKWMETSGTFYTSGFFFLCTPEKNSRGQKLKKLKTQEKNSKLKPKPQFSGIFQKILQIVYFLKRRYNLS